MVKILLKSKQNEFGAGSIPSRVIAKNQYPDERIAFVGEHLRLRELIVVYI